MRLRIEKIQAGVATACRKAIPVISVDCKAEMTVVGVWMLVEFSEVGLTQSEHLLVAML